MTAQANTVGQADANAQSVPQASTPQVDLNGTHAQDLTGVQAGIEANPQVPANPQATDGSVDLDNQIQTDEKRLEDKSAYAAKLAEQLKDADRTITENQKMLKQRQAMSHQEPGATRQTEHTELPADSSGIGQGQEFINALNDNPDKAIADLRASMAREILGDVNRQQIGNQLGERAQHVQESLGENHGLFQARLNEYKSQGLLPSPEQVGNDIRFGPIEQQTRLMELGMLALQQQQNASPQTNQQAPVQPQQPQPNRLMMAPGGGGQPANTQQPQQLAAQGQRFGIFANGG
jgi:hypothetical protein